MHRLERRVARFEPSPAVGNRMHVLEVPERVSDPGSWQSHAVNALLETVGKKPGDLTVIVRRFHEDDGEVGELTPLPLD